MICTANKYIYEVIDGIDDVVELSYSALLRAARLWVWQAVVDIAFGQLCRQF